ncbi:MAG TPA: ATP-binding protein [Chryseolinea sp.]|nr:ATP-binding protein [Chryseolinea sp.]
MHSTVRRNHQSKKFSAGFVLLFMLLVSHVSFGQQPIEWTKHNFLWQGQKWKYQGGVPKQEYLELDYDDQSWSDVHTDSVGFVASDKSSWPGIGVFRMKFNVPDSLRGQRAELILLTSAGALDIYLDGKLITQSGTVAANAADEVVTLVTTPQYPIQVELDDKPSHVIAVSYSNHDSELISSEMSGFVIMLAPGNAIGYTKDSFPQGIPSMCIILAFCLFFWFVYAFYPFRLASLLSALYIANFSLIFIGGFTTQQSHSLDSFMIGVNLWRIGFACNPGWILLFLYATYFNRLPKRSWIVVALMILCAAISIFSNAIPIPFNIILPIFIPLQVEAWRIIILGIIKKKTGFWILAIGVFVSVCGAFIVIFNVFNFFPWYVTTTHTVLEVMTDLSFPLTLALHFAWEFGSANRDLSRQLDSVKALSIKNLEQEQEKQQILSSQNETLEKQVAERTSEVMARNKEIEKQRDQVSTTLQELRATQNQLIQSEKMASLGELTAGIAHEIQNPLNFVNNFSELNKELLSEMKEEIEKGNLEEVKSIAVDVIENQEKINHHGKRADGIVKGMLQHSRTSGGVKEPTDITILADEYSRLAYHGLRAKDKSFNAKIETDFDQKLRKVQVIPQDIGRVIVNLLNNAFYAVTEKARYLQPDGSAQHEYMPTVTVSTRMNGDRVLISVRDNGNGIPQKVLDKIFQPFFTTKPTGQGTGLGLSLSYDIVKAHGGELRVETAEGKGSEFIIALQAHT